VLLPCVFCGYFEFFYFLAITDLGKNEPVAPISHAVAAYAGVRLPWCCIRVRAVREQLLIESLTSRQRGLTASDNTVANWSLRVTSFSLSLTIFERKSKKKVVAIHFNKEKTPTHHNPGFYKGREKEM
jgi:hypothetical protein